jgi:hypothetical protein
MHVRRGTAAVTTAHQSLHPAVLYALIPGIYLVDLVHYKGKGQRAENRIVRLLLIYPHDLQ